MISHDRLDHPSAPHTEIDPARVARFNSVARPVIVGLLILFAAAVLLQRAIFPVDENARYASIVGRPYTDIFLYFGPPRTENDDGRGGRVAHYDEFRVVGDHFEKKEFRVFVNADERVYKFERD